MVDRTAEAFGMDEPVRGSRGRNVPRRTRVEDQTEEAFAEPELDVFSLPMGADPAKDALVGEDELGNKVYKSPLGVRYTIKTVQPPERFTTEPATMARVGEVAQQYATGAIEGLTGAITAPGRALAGEPVTTGEVLDTAGLAATGAIPSIARGAIEGVDPNVATIFGGYTGKRTLEEDALGYNTARTKVRQEFVDAYDRFNVIRQELADEKQQQNLFVPEESINYEASQKLWEETGYFVGQDGTLRFEIDDSKAVITPTPLTSVKDFTEARSVISSGTTTTTLKDFLQHDDLYAAYPEIKDLPVFVDRSLAGTNTRGWFDPLAGQLSISLNPELLSNKWSIDNVALSTLLHEIQHYVQNKEGFDEGVNLDAPELVKIYDAEVSKKRGAEIWDNYEKQKVQFETTLEKTKSNAVSSVIDYYITLFSEDYGANAKKLSRAVFDYEGSNKTTKDEAEFKQAVEKAVNPSIMFSFSRKKAPTDLVQVFVDLNKYKNTDLQDFMFNVSISRLLENNKEDFNSHFNFDNVDIKDIVDSFGRFKRDTVGYELFLPKDVQLPERPIFIDSSVPFGPDQIFDIYQRRSGETESRNVQKRRKFTAEERARLFPRQTENVLPQFQWTGAEIVSKGYAEGGTVMPNTETQMNRLMQEGGIADDGMRRDPVSGNEIPPGSMATEVRDDIPAQLSEGEYIVPADVLRYYGVAFFEQLRAKAKRGLAEMEAGGRIGGEPVEMEDEDELPFDISELETAGDDTDMQMAAMGMAKGGVVKMQEGGMPVATSSFNPANWATPGSSYFQQTGAQQQSEYRVYQNAQGQTISILFINGVAQQPIPEGFFPQGQGPKVEQPTPADRGDRDETPQPPQKSFNEYTAEDWISYKPDTGVGSTLGQIAGGIIGGALLGPAGAMLGAKGMQESMARNSISAYNSLNEYVGAMNKSDPNYSALADKRNKMYGDLTAAQEENPGFFSNIINSVFGKPTINPPKTGAAAAARAATTAAAPATSRDDDKAPAAATGGGAAAAPAGTTTLGGKTVSVGYGAGQVDPGLAKAAAAAEKSKATSAATAQSYGASVDKTSKKAEDVSVLAKGGLMQKPKPKKPTQKRNIKTVST